MSASVRAFLGRVLIAAIAVTMTAVVIVVVGDQYGKREFAKRSTVHIDDGILAPESPAQPTNFLLFGHDATGNSDTMMIVHLVPGERPLVVSFPRDLFVSIPGHGRGMLNSAFGTGGPGLLVQTFASAFHVPIHHFLEVDFSTFPKVVDAIGKVKVWFPTPVHDPYIGLHVEQPGCLSLNGQMALAYVRSRHYYVPKDVAHPAPWQWNYDPRLSDSDFRGGTGWTAQGSDIERIPRQQYFLRTIAQTALDRTNDDPTKLFRLIDAVMSNLTTDRSLTFGELKRFVRSFRSLKPSDVDMTTVPWSPDPATNGNRVLIKYPDASALLDHLADLAPPKVVYPTLADPATVRLRVVNGSGVPGLGDSALGALTAAGFRAAGPVVDADRTDYAQTEIRWQSTQNPAGVTTIVATGAHDFGQARVDTDTLGGDVLVIIGKDWNSLAHNYIALPGHHVDPGATSSTSTTTTAPSTTTSSPVDSRYLPSDPRDGGTLVGCPS